MIFHGLCHTTKNVLAMVFTLKTLGCMGSSSNENIQRIHSQSADWKYTFLNEPLDKGTTHSAFNVCNTQDMSVEMNLS